MEQKTKGLKYIIQLSGILFSQMIRTFYSFVNRVTGACWPPCVTQVASFELVVNSSRGVFRPAEGLRHDFTTFIIGAEIFTCDP